MSAITFVYPDFENLGVEYLMAVCKERGYDVHFFYYEAEDPYTGFKRRPNYETIAKAIAEKESDFVVFSCVTDNFRHQLNCAAALKKINPTILTVFGGIHVTSVPERVFKNNCVDVVAIGEGEDSLPRFFDLFYRQEGLKPTGEKVKGVVYKIDGSAVGDYVEGEPVDLDSLPFPEKKKVFDAMGYVPSEYYVITGRGCPYRCSYCYNSLTKKGYYRRRSVENVIKELRWAKEQFNIKYVHFCDDSFSSGKEWLRSFCERYRKEINLPFLCSANPVQVDEEIVSLLKKAGCVDVQIGVQSLSEEICKQVLKRRCDVGKTEKIIKLIRNAGMMVQADHMLGIVGDTLENEEDAILFYKKAKPTLVSVFWLTYYPGTEIVKIAKEKGVLTEEDVEKIEEGFKITEGNLHKGGSMKNPEIYYPVEFMLNYLFIMPEFMVKLLVKTGLYRMFRIKSYFIKTALPRLFRAIFDKRYFTGRGYILRFTHRFMRKLSA